MNLVYKLPFEDVRPPDEVQYFPQHGQSKSVHRRADPEQLNHPLFVIILYLLI